MFNRPMYEGTEPNAHNLELYFESNDLDSVYLKLKKLEIPFVHDLFEQLWGQRVFRVYDPDGYIV